MKAHRAGAPGLSGSLHRRLFEARPRQKVDERLLELCELLVRPEDRPQWSERLSVLTDDQQNKVQDDVRKIERENLRLAERLIDSESEDADIDEKVVVEGSAPIVVNSDARRSGDG